MSSNNDKILPPEELRRRNARDLDIAAKTGVQVVLTQDNWQALISLQNSILQAQNKQTQAFQELLKREDAENYLSVLGTLETNIANELQEDVTRFQQQAGKLNEKFSSASDKLVHSSQQAMEQITKQNKQDLEWSREAMGQNLSRLQQKFRTWLQHLALLAAGSIALLTMLFGLLMWQLH